jgi:hypothetical protein
MAQMEFYCPQCEEVIFSDPGLAGETIDCPHCYHEVIIPEGEEHSA